VVWFWDMASSGLISRATQWEWPWASSPKRGSNGDAI